MKSPPHYFIFIACPPNSFLKEETSLLENSSAPQLLFRTNNESAITGVGTPRRSASSSVHFASPLLPMTHSIFSSLGSLRNASCANSINHERMTEPLFHTLATFSLSNVYSECSKILKPSPIACIIPYSTPL